MKGSKMKDIASSTGNVKGISHMLIFQVPNMSSWALYPCIWTAFHYLPSIVRSSLKSPKQALYLFLFCLTIFIMIKNTGGAKMVEE